ncbi:MAG: MFS transporter [Chloroflexota bacterium]|uniref:Major facilitator superfamily (MFS) profile domain-containing protein n=1 Tax=marine metagenome TaxID=408172 RepID=A0A381RBY0_9ZZZZ|nr:MFS transporter [Chloroflexota bacterium]MEE3168267.1 MFS transporter [Chloroflexota bacterium]
MIRRSIYSQAWASSFRFRDFRLFWASTFFYSLGTGMEHVAVGWLVFDITGSAFIVGVAAAARMAPLFFLGILSGAMADWLERRLFLLFIALSGMAVAGIMAVVLLTGEPPIWAVIVLVAAGGCMLAFTLTTRNAYTYDIVGPEHALNGLSLNQMAMQAGGIGGAIISGALIELVGPGWQYLAVGASYLGSALVLLVIGQSTRTAQPLREPVLQNLVGYLRFLRENRLIFILMCLTSITEVLGFTHMTLLPVFAKEVLHVGPAGLGYLTAVRQAGGLLGLALLANLRDYRRKGLLMFIIATGFGVGLMAFSVSAALVYFIIVLAAVNACAMAVDTLYKTLMQSNVPDEQRGRAMGSWVLSIGAAPVGHLGVGGLATALGAQGALLVNGAVLAGISLVAAIGLPKIRRLE